MKRSKFTDEQILAVVKEGETFRLLCDRGRGELRGGARRAALGPGAVAWSTPGEPHGVANDSDGNLVLLVAVASNPNR